MASTSPGIQDNQPFVLLIEIMGCYYPEPDKTVSWQKFVAAWPERQ